MAAPGASDKKLDFDTEWAKATSQFDIILNALETGQGITGKEWIATYYVVFSLAIAQNEGKIYDELAKVFREFVDKQSKQIFEKKTNADAMLKEYLRLFGNFTRTATSVSKICKYLERYWIPNHNGRLTENKIEIRSIYPLSLIMWREHCFAPIKDKLIPALLGLLDKDRAGDKQDKTLLRNMVQSYVEYDAVGPTEGQQFYEKEFECRYIHHLKEFYASESSNFLQQNGVSLYLMKAESRIEEEKVNSEYLGLYLNSSEPKIKKAIDEVLIEKHMDIIQQDFLRMLKEDKNEDMRRLYFLLSRVADGLPSSANTMQAYLTENGSKIVQEQKERDLKDSLAFAVPFVKSLMLFYEKYSGLVSSCFSNNPLFKTALDKAFRDILNQESGKFNIPRLLNFFIDNVVKGKEKDYTTEDEIDDILQKLVNLFSYLQDKDEFFEYFRKALCKRLLSKGKQYNENAEKSFLSKLKAQSGDAAIRKLQGMFTDVQDESINEGKNKFEEHNGGTSKVDSIDFEVHVLNDSHWPITATQKFPLLLASNLFNCQKKFQQYYDSSSEKRKLQWLYNYGTVTLAARFTNSKVPVQLILTPLQASIMVCFNASPKLTFEELLTQLWPTQPARSILTTSQNSNQVHDMSLEEILKFAISPLVYFKYKILQKEHDADPKKENIKNDDVFILRDRIPAKKLPRKIAFPPGSAKQTQREADQDHEYVMKQREFEIEAAMVRVMKARNRLEWNKVQVEVINILQSRFTPDAKQLKKRLESLIDRKYMERDENDPKVIVYIS
eukprot:TRINITY_DN804_c0_g1_i1.p1 TRINITY_DN804_c0_g1~~TRINITY_DN804_c0_g1_i1.p1  ORF type:complete len:783 (-),score=238.21 TRINITY_DN804_c0_g1_i1:51-2399(-)